MTNETSGTAGAPLQGVVVLDLTQIYNGPYATFLMAMAGADVVKIEPPDGEHLRRRPNSGGTTEPFAVLNANKRSLVLDLKTDVGRQVLLELVRKADVLVENYAPGVMARLNLGADTLHQTNPRLVIASGNGYGAEGAYRDFTAEPDAIPPSSTGLDRRSIPAHAAVWRMWGSATRRIRILSEL